MREKLSDIISDYADFLPWETIDAMADSIIENGFTIPVRCKDCKYAVGHDGIHKTVLCQKRSAYPKQWDEMPFDGFCSYGERREGE